jgi:predicted AAA+ superfamily ATPase
MLIRKAHTKLFEMAKKFPVLAITGPRQSGKTTMAKMTFPNYRYVNLENPDTKLFATSDPKGFLKTYDKFVIFDEIQNVPELFSYLQEIVDESNIDGQFILSGSQNFLLLEKITQSLAGRVYMMELLPLALNELAGHESFCFDSIVKGYYPRIYDKNIKAQDFYASYVKTYVERDVTSIVNIHDLSTFRKFFKLLSHYAGQQFNASKIANDLKIDVKTAQRWLSILESSYLVFTLPVWHQNFAKRIIKNAKLYFYDTGLLSYLLGIKTGEELLLSKYKGALFENFALVEIMKNYKNCGISVPFYYWRDSNGNEIDLIIEDGMNVKLIEMKASETVKADYLKSLHYLDKLNTEIPFKHYLVNSGTDIQKRSLETIVAWKNTEIIID